MSLQNFIILGIMGFRKLICLQRKNEKKMYTNLNEYHVENCLALPGWNLISPCNLRVKSAPVGRVEISCRPTRIHVITTFAEMKFQPVQPGQNSPYDYMGKSSFIPARRDRSPPCICLIKTIDFHWFKNVHRMMKFFKDICLHFSHRLNVIHVVKIQ